jgi:hypothetical protein
MPASRHSTQRAAAYQSGQELASIYENVSHSRGKRISKIHPHVRTAFNAVRRAIPVAGPKSRTMAGAAGCAFNALIVFGQFTGRSAIRETRWVMRFPLVSPTSAFREERVGRCVTLAEGVQNVVLHPQRWQPAVGTSPRKSLPVSVDQTGILRSPELQLKPEKAR